MAAPYETPTPAGVNASLSSAPGFNQSLGGELIAPGRQERPRLERTEQLRSLLSTAGQAVTGAVASQARVQAIARARVEERRAANARLAQQVARQKAEQDDAEQAAYRRSAQERVKQVARTQFDILRDPRSENHEWTMQEAVIRQNNAEFPEERDAWMDFIVTHQEAGRRDAKASAERTARVATAGLVSDRRIAANTAKNAIDDLSNQVENSPDERRRLIGDGSGINSRVQEFVMREAMSAAPDLFNLSKEDPLYPQKLEQQALLIEELEARAQHTIVNPLVDQFRSDHYKSAEDTGKRRINIAAQAYAEGDMTPSEYHDLVGSILSDNFKHVDPRQREAKRAELYRQQFDRLATLLDQPDPGRALEAMEGLLSVADLASEERAVIRNEIISEKFPRAVQNRLSEQYRQKMAEASGLAELSENGVTVPRDPRLIQVEMLENGTYEDMAAQLLDDLNVPSDPKAMTPLQASLFSAVWEQMADERTKAESAQVKAVQSVDRSVRHFAGQRLSDEEAAKKWGEGPLMRVLSGTLSPSDPVFQSLATQYKGATGKDFPVGQDGKLPLNAETQPIFNELARSEAQRWSNNKLTSFPRDMGETVSNATLSGNAQQFAVAMSFWRALSPDGQERMQVPAQAQAVLMAASVMADDANLPAIDMLNRARQWASNAATASLRLKSAGRDDEGMSPFLPNATEREGYDAALSSVLGRSVNAGGYGVSLGADELGQVFGSNEALIPIYMQMQIVMDATPGTTIKQAAAEVVAQMRGSKHKLVEGVAGPQVIRDFHGHYPVDVTPRDVLLGNLTDQLTKEQAARFIARLPDPDPATQAIAARDGATVADILFSYYAAGVGPVSVEPGADPQAAMPHPRSWDFLPVTYGEVFEGSMRQESGGVPMQLSIPHERFPRGFIPTDKNGNPLLTVSSRRRTEAPRPVNKQGIPDYFLTPAGRRKVPLRPDMGQRMEQAIRSTIPSIGNPAAAGSVVGSPGGY